MTVRRKLKIFMKKPTIAKSDPHPLAYRSTLDVVSRVSAVGIFVIENLNHFLNFQAEVDTLVIPAITPFPPLIAPIVHASTIFLGLTGSVMVS